METKPWYVSKTIWANVLMYVAMIASKQFGFEVSVEEQGAVLLLVNVILRAVTKGKIRIS